MQELSGLDVRCGLDFVFLTDRGGVLCSDLGGRLGNEEKKKKKTLGKKNVVLFIISINVGWAYAHP